VLVGPPTEPRWWPMHQTDSWSALKIRMRTTPLLGEARHNPPTPSAGQRTLVAKPRRAPYSSHITLNRIAASSRRAPRWAWPSTGPRTRSQTAKLPVQDVSTTLLTHKTRRPSLLQHPLGMHQWANARGWTERPETLSPRAHPLMQGCQRQSAGYGDT
jgi:hypothetical protein